MNVPKNILFRMNMDSEEELVEHVTVDGCNETDSLCEMEESLELTGTRSTAALTVAATTSYKKDVDIEKLLLNTTEPTTIEFTTDKSHIKELLNLMLIEEKKRLALMERMEMQGKMESEVKENIRTGLKLILECLENTKFYFDRVENMPMYQKWEEKLKNPIKNNECEEKNLGKEYEIWMEICMSFENRREWKDYERIFENFWEDLEEEELDILTQCGRLGIQMKAQKEKILWTGEEYWRINNLTGTSSQASLLGTATSNHERDIDMEETTNHEVTTLDSVEDLTNKWDSKELQNSILIEEKKTLEKVSEMEEKKELLPTLNEQIRTMLGLILEKREIRKIYYDKVETLPWFQPEIIAQMVKCEKESIEQEYEIWKELRKTLNDDWKRDNEIIEEYLEDFEEEDLELMKECKRLENYLKTKKEKLVEASTAYFRKAGLNI